MPKQKLKISLILPKSKQEFPMASSKITAGFPSPADDFMEGALDLNEFLIKHPSATFLVRVEGDSMIGAGIHNGDVLIIDRSLEPHDGSIVIAAVDGELTVKKLFKQNGKIQLIAENKNYKPIEINNEELVIWGVVTNVIHKV